MTARHRTTPKAGEAVLWLVAWLCAGPLDKASRAFGLAFAGVAQ